MILSSPTIRVNREAVAIKRNFAFPKTSSITIASSSNCLVSYPGHWYGESYPAAEMQSMYSTPRVDWVELIVFIDPGNTYQCCQNRKISINFNGMSTYLVLFYDQILRNHVHCTFIFTFFCVVVFQEDMLRTVQTRKFNFWNRSTWNKERPKQYYRSW